MPRIAVNGAELHFEDTGGPGAPVVFSHGLLMSGRMYDAQIAALRDRFRCVSFDHRGQGRSAVAASGYDLETVAEDAAALLRALSLIPCHFAGLSMGGFVGIRLAARQPAMIRSLVLLDTAADAEPLANRARYTALAAMARVFGLQPVVGAAMKRLYGKTFLADPARSAEREEMKRRFLATDVTGAVRALGGVVSRASVEDELSSIRCPTLVLSGDEDAAVVPARSAHTARLILSARFQLIPRAGHSSPIEQPQAVTAALRAFLERVEADLPQRLS
jgi:pimeloyl-ACP methyl ester carboxylesterase